MATIYDGRPNIKKLKTSVVHLLAISTLVGCSTYPVYSPHENANNPTVSFHSKLRPPLLLALEEIHICSDQKKFKVPLELNVEIKGSDYLKFS